MGSELAAPGYMHRLREPAAAAMVRDILQRELGAAEYPGDQAADVGRRLGALIEQRLAAEPGWARYKFIANIVLLGAGAGARMGVSSLWDPHADHVVHESLTTPRLRCVAAVFAVCVY